jgi:hypothetical protein
MDYAIIECAKRSFDSEEKKKLVEFFNTFRLDVLKYCEIDKTSKMYSWDGNEWIDNIKQDNPIISCDILDYFEDCLNDELENYATEIAYDMGNYLYVLFGVYWHVYLGAEWSDKEVNGPSTDKEWIMIFMP